MRNFSGKPFALCMVHPKHSKQQVQSGIGCSELVNLLKWRGEGEGVGRGDKAMRDRVSPRNNAAVSLSNSRKGKFSLVRTKCLTKVPKPRPDAIGRERQTETEQEREGLCVHSAYHSGEKMEEGWGGSLPGLMRIFDAG